ncbi:hypothetical protein KDW_02570 [Dictyobacter vulcani]|uniref:Uncharacterized protein n=1 Tax=Dictyobacter vulcani TaxID=2607529 RepID=A0A5J4KFI2_9CHLR|nr:hypothetical protein [Dictyobacter vulcani]GER86095.1 hypothetical protein KDW_02570 [Dictyobacter vulcani]
MSMVEQIEQQERPTQVMKALSLKKTDTLSRKFLSLLFMGGACCVITLYLVIPLMIFLNVFQDWIEQLLCAVLILTMSEFIVFSVLIKTSQAAKAKTSNATNIEHATKHADHDGLWQIQEDEQSMVPFDELINTPTMHVAALKK